MHEITFSPQQCGGAKRRGIEFRIYYGLIFVLALPVKMVRWIRDIVSARSLKVRGPIARALSEADRVTPIIFSA